MSASVATIHSDRFVRVADEHELTRSLLALRNAQLRELAGMILDPDVSTSDLTDRARGVLEHIARPSHD